MGIQGDFKNRIAEGSKKHDPEGHDFTVPAPPSTRQAATNSAGPRRSSKDGQVADRRARSRSPVTGLARDRRYNQDSRAHKAARNVATSIREHPSLEELKQPGVRTVTLTIEQVNSIVAEASRSARDAVAEKDATAWEVLQNPIPYQIPLDGLSMQNSSYDNTKIEMRHLKEWANFPTFESVEKFIKDNPKLHKIFRDVYLENAGSKVWFESKWDDPSAGYVPANEENSLVRNSHHFFAQLSALIRLACQGHSNKKNEVRLSTSSRWVTIGGGKCAMKRRAKWNPDRKVPDSVAFWTDRDHSQLNVRKGKVPAREIDCLIVGDFKMATKFRRSMLLPIDEEFDVQGNYVANQIHDYMDMHHNRYGYIITHTELIMFRRREDPLETWGQMDFSESIPVSTGRGKLNAMMVLWYFHVKYAVLEEDGGWRLESYSHNYKHVLRPSVRNRK